MKDERVELDVINIKIKDIPYKNVMMLNHS